jgi:phosphate/sulfate permease
MKAIEFVVSLIASAGISAAMAGFVVWLTKSWISERLKSSIKHEYDEKIETHKAQLKAQSDLEAERLRSQLNIASIEHEVKFAGLHNKRAEVIAELYSLLVQAY